MLSVRLLGLAACFLLHPAVSQALVLQFGQSVVEQGDFLLQQGVQLGLTDQDNRHLRLDFYGRRFGAFTEATAIVGLDLPLPIFPWPSLTAHYGLSLMDQYTARDAPGSPKAEIHALNIGANVGLDWQLYAIDRWRLDAAWNSHIFPAGAAFIFFVTGRKSVFTLALGYTL